MSAYYYTTPCAFCEHPITKGAETKGVFTEWSHSDKNVCRANIRGDARNEVREAVLERREQFMRVTHTSPEHPMARIYDEFLALLEGKPDDARD